MNKLPYHHALHKSDLPGYHVSRLQRLKDLNQSHHYIFAHPITVLCRPILVLAQTRYLEQLCKSLLFWVDYLHTITVEVEISIFSCAWFQDFCSILNGLVCRVATKSLSVVRASFVTLLNHCRANPISSPLQEIELGSYQLVVIRLKPKFRNLQCWQSNSQKLPHCYTLNFSLTNLTELPICECTLAKCWRWTLVSTHVIQHSNGIVHSCELTVQVFEFPSRTMPPVTSPKILCQKLFFCNIEGANAKVQRLFAEDGTVTSLKYVLNCIPW